MVATGTARTVHCRALFVTEAMVPPWAADSPGVRYGRRQPLVLAQILPRHSGITWVGSSVGLSVTASIGDQLVQPPTVSGTIQAHRQGGRYASACRFRVSGTVLSCGLTGFQNR